MLPALAEPAQKPAASAVSQTPGVAGWFAVVAQTELVVSQVPLVGRLGSLLSQ